MPARSGLREMATGMTCRLMLRVMHSCRRLTCISVKIPISVTTEVGRAVLPIKENSLLCQARRLTGVTPTLVVKRFERAGRVCRNRSLS